MGYMKLCEIKPLKESFTVSNKIKKVKEYDYDIGDDIEKDVNYTEFKYTDTIGGRAYGDITDDNARIVGMNSVPSEFKYSADESKYKQRGFFKNLLRELYLHGIKTVTINTQSSDTQKAVARLLSNNILLNPRNYGGISTNEHPRTFDINPDIAK